MGQYIVHYGCFGVSSANKLNVVMFAVVCLDEVFQFLRKVPGQGVLVVFLEFGTHCWVFHVGRELSRLHRTELAQRLGDASGRGDARLAPAVALQARVLAAVVSAMLCVRSEGGGHGYSLGELDRNK